MPNSNTVFRVRVSGDATDLRKFLVAHPLEPQSVEVRGHRVSMDLVLNEAQRRELEHRGLRVEQLLDLAAHARARRVELAHGNRFDGGKHPPGLGIKRS